MNYDTLNFYRRECYGNYLLLKETDTEYHPKEVRLLNNSFRTCLKKVIKETKKLLKNLEDIDIYPEVPLPFSVNLTAPPVIPPALLSTPPAPIPRGPNIL